MQNWAVDNHERRIRREEEESASALKMIHKQKEDERMSKERCLIASDERELQTDEEETFKIIQIMRKSGDIPGREVVVKSLQVENKNIRIRRRGTMEFSSEDDARISVLRELDLYLRNPNYKDNTNIELEKRVQERTGITKGDKPRDRSKPWEGGSRHPFQAGREEEESIFTCNLSEAKEVKLLRGHGVGRFGVVKLAAELARGNCSLLETLDLNRCNIQSKGLGNDEYLLPLLLPPYLHCIYIFLLAYLLQGIKSASLLHLRSLILRSNSLNTEAIIYLTLAFKSFSLDNLRSLDLRNNELADKGVALTSFILLAFYLLSFLSFSTLLFSFIFFDFRWNLCRTCTSPWHLWETGDDTFTGKYDHRHRIRENRDYSRIYTRLKVSSCEDD